MLKKLSYVFDAILIIIIGLLGYVQISMIVTKSRNYGVPKAFGVSIMYVATNSMEDPENPDALNPGTGIIIKQVDPATLVAADPIYDEEDPTKIVDYKKNHDIVTFYWEKIKAADTHRLVGIEYREEEGKYYFTTMGDNPEAHQKHITETWSEDYLIGKVIYSSAALGKFLEISSPEAAAYYSARTGENASAWFFPVAILVPIGIIAVIYIIKGGIKYHKESQEREAQILKAMEEAGIDMNDDEAVELFRMKEEIRMDIREETEKEYKKAKEQLLKELKKKQKQEETEEKNEK